MVGYPAILPEDPDDCSLLIPIFDEDVNYLRDKLHEINGLMADVAAAHGAGYIDTYTGTVGHDICQSASVKWYESWFPTGAVAMPAHPNADGMAAVGAIVAAAIDAP